MTPLRVGIGFGIAGLLMYGLASALPAGSKIRYVNVDGRTFKVTRLGGGKYEIATWGVLIDKDPSTPPLATLLLGQDGLINAEGNPELIDIVRSEMHRMPPNLFDPSMDKCSRPGCFVQAPAVSGQVTAKQILLAAKRRGKRVRAVLPYCKAMANQLRLEGLEYVHDPSLNVLKVLRQ